MTFIESLQKDMNELGYTIKYNHKPDGKIKSFNFFKNDRTDYLVDRNDVRKVEQMLRSKEIYQYLACLHKKGEGKILNKISIKRRNNKKREQRKRETENILNPKI